MRLQDILSMATGYLELGIVLLVIVLVAILVGYFGIYIKLCKGKRKLDFKQIFWWFILIFYLFVVLSVTLFRTYSSGSGQIISLFYSYKEAWISASETDWRYIVLNILMFVPLGFWLPFGKKRFRVFWKTYLLGFVLTVGIELFQMVFSLGLCEVADVFNNTLGTMLGYGFYKVVECVVLFCKKERPKVFGMVISQIPLILAVCMFAIIFVVYQKQELGNLQIECISPYKKDAFQIVSNEVYSENQKKMLVYQTNRLTVEETEVFARTFFENLGTTLDETRIDVYENTAVYWASDSYSIWVDYKGGTYDMTDFDTSFPDEDGEQPQEVTDATKEVILEALNKYGIEIPEGASFSYTRENGYAFTVEQWEKDGIMYDGVLTCDYYDNGKFANIRNGIGQYTVYKEFEIRSEQEAYEQIVDGKFVWAANAGGKMEVGKVSLDYMLDTKGFYQPVYSFEVRVEGEEYWVQIPGISEK